MATLRKPSTSVRQITVLGFLVIVLILIGASASAGYQVSKLSRYVQAIVSNTAQGAEAAQLLASQTTSMERTIGQYWVLREASLLVRYKKQRARFTETVARLTTPGADRQLMQKIALLTKHEREVFRRMEGLQTEVVVPTLPEPVVRLTEYAAVIPYYVARRIAQEHARISAQIDRVHQVLVWQATALIPLALIAAVAFSFWISSALDSLGRAIRQLGEGKFNVPIAVAGPRDVQQLGERLDWLRMQIRATDLYKTRFIQTISHEIKTPLTSIREGIELLSDEVTGSLSPAQTEVVDIILTNARRLQIELTDMLNFNRLEIEGQPTAKETVDLRQVMVESLEAQRLRLQAKQLNVAADLQSAPVQGVAPQLRIILDNLLSNAINFSPRRGVLSIVSKIQNQQASVEITDQGPGINPADMEAVFEPFYQGKKLSGAPGTGSGLGLAIARYYAQRNGGDVYFAVDCDSGAHVQFTIPAIQTADEAKQPS